MKEAPSGHHHDRHEVLRGGHYQHLGPRAVVLKEDRVLVVIAPWVVSRRFRIRRRAPHVRTHVQREPWSRGPPVQV